MHADSKDKKNAVMPPGVPNPAWARKLFENFFEE
jgi:hypothetical protein